MHGKCKMWVLTYPIMESAMGPLHFFLLEKKILNSQDNVGSCG